MHALQYRCMTSVLRWLSCIDDSVCIVTRWFMHERHEVGSGESQLAVGDLDMQGSKTSMSAVTSF